MSKRLGASLLAVVLLLAFVFNGTVAVFADTLSLQITQQPTDTFGKLDQTVRTSIVAEGEGLKYQWFYKNANMTNFAKAKNDTTSYIFELTEAKNGRQVYCVVTDKYGNSLVSDTATFRISTLSLTKQPVNTAGAVGSTVYASVAAEGEEISYQWYEKDAGAADFVASTVGDTYAFELADENASREVYCVVTDKYGDSVKSKTVVLEVAHSVTIVKQPVDTYGKIGDTVKTAVVANGNGLTYAWYVKSPGATKFSKSSLTSASYSFKLTEEKVGRQVYCVVTDKYGNSVQSETVTFTTTELTITQQPVGAISGIGKTVRTSVIAEGIGLKYQWYVKNPGASAFTKSSITIDTYTFQLSEANDGRQIYCVITDVAGNSVKSDTVTFSTSDLAITKQPDNVFGGFGMTLRTSVAAAGEELKYQWYVKDPGASAFVKASAVTETYVFELDEASNGRQVYCVVTDKYGTSVQSEIATFSTSGLAITEQPSDTVGGIGSTVRTSIVADGEELKYQWYVKNPGAADFVKASAITDTYVFQLTEANNGRQVYCVVTDKYGTFVQSEIATFSLTAPVIVQQPVGGIAMIDEQLRTTVVAEGEGLKYQWYVKNPGAADFSKSSFAAATYIFEMNAASDGRQIYCVVTDKFGTSVTSEIATFYRKYTAEIATQPTNLIGYIDETVSTTVAAKGDGLVYQWYVKAAGAEEFVLADVEGDTFSLELAAEHDGYQFYCVVTDELGYVDTSDVATVTVYAGILTLDYGNETTDTINIPADGSYALEAPEREGFTFLGWVDEEGNPVAAEGTLIGNATFTATWEALYNDALANSKYLLEEGEINVAYLGGSITSGYGSTAGNSWRALTNAWLAETYPDATINEINAAVGGTGTYYAKHRLEKDVLRHNPDLLFIEFVVNDELEHTTAAQSTENMEAIVRKALQHNPNMDIVFVYTTSVSIGTAKENTWINAFNAVAAHYDIEVIYAGAAMGEYEGALTDLFLADQVHPNDAGYAILADEVIGNVDALFGMAGEPAALEAHAVPASLIPDINLNNKTVYPARLQLQNEALAIGSQSFVGYNGESLDMNPGDVFTFTFQGESVGIYWRSETEGGVSITVTLDGSETVTKKAPKNSNGISYELFRGLDGETTHTITFENTGDAVLQIPFVFVNDTAPTHQIIGDISVPATGYSPDDRIQIGEITVDGLDMSIEIKNISRKWESGDGESYFEYTCYDAEGNELSVGYINFGYIATRSNKVCTIVLAEGTAKVELTDFHAEYWSKLV
ncbi:MAG: SGNH/GDSL hydrolase family protein [Clostridia bacterium]|nr:SGNH/GDSL hydrolase family protein [Clostridia bacterium]